MNFADEFSKEEKSLLESLGGANPGLAEKQRDIEKIEKEEMKKLDKTLFKKDQLEVEEGYSNNNAKAMRDRIMKTINEGIVK